MMARRGVLGLLAGAATFLLTACGRSPGTLRCRVTIEVETPQGLKTGFSVVENRNWKPPSMSFGVLSSGGASTYGEAPTVDLGNGRVLFAPLHDPNYSRRIYQMLMNMLRYDDLDPPLSRRYKSGEWPESYTEATDLESFAVIQRKDYPMLVTFGDLADPTSVKEVNPDNLAGTFGSGYRLKRITAQVTDEDITMEFEELFPAIANFKKTFGSISARRIDTPITSRLQKPNFIQRDK